MFHASLQIRLNKLAHIDSNYNPLCEIDHNFKQCNLDSNDQAWKKMIQVTLGPFLFFVWKVLENSIYINLYINAFTTEFDL